MKYLILIALIIASIFIVADVRSLSYNEVSDIVSDYQDVELTHTSLAILLRRAQVQHPEVAFRQAILESGNLQSGLTRRGNNIFGMKKPRRRETYALKRTLYGGYATYAHWSYSVLDYKLWQGERPIENYYRHLSKRGYSTNGRYVLSLKKIFIADSVKQLLM